MKNETYFDVIRKKYGNGFWVNNPTMEQADLAIAAGSISCTTNPTYAEKMRVSETDGERLSRVISDILSREPDDREAARKIQREAVMPLLEKFYPLHKKSGGTQGFVSIQGDPLAETDPAMIIKEAIEDRKMGDNIIAKIPVTEAGLEAIGYLAGENVPIIATEIMGISQAVSVCETYMAAVKGKNYAPALYVTHISGIFDDFMNARVKELGVDIPEDVLQGAGLMIARKQYDIMQSRGYPGKLLGGGARGLRHFTGLVGGDADITINWKGTADELLRTNPEVKNEIEKKPDPEHVKTLLELIPEYALAYGEDALAPKDFESFGPVTLFRNSFLKAWLSLLDAIKDIRVENA